jgi:hypothetical protein
MTRNTSCTSDGVEVKLAAAAATLAMAAQRQFIALRARGLSPERMADR